MFYIGVDPDKSKHTLVVCDISAKILFSQSFKADLNGYQQALLWCKEKAPERIWGIENPQAFARNFAQYLLEQGENVKSVPTHLTKKYRKRSLAKGKTDKNDALAVARALLQEDNLPDVPVESKVHELKLWIEHYDNLQKEMTQQKNRLHAHLMNFVENYKEFGDINKISTVKKWLAIADDKEDARAKIIVSLCQRLIQLNSELNEIEKHLKAIVKGFDAQPLLNIKGIGYYLAAKIIAEAVSPDLFRSEAAFASYAGIAPIPFSSGRTNIHIVNVGGNRQLNYAIDRMVFTQLTREPLAIEYYQRKIAEGKTKKEAKRCLKRLAARRVFRALQQIPKLRLTNFSQKAA